MPLHNIFIDNLKSKMAYAFCDEVQSAQPKVFAIPTHVQDKQFISSSLILQNEHVGDNFHCPGNVSTFKYTTYEPSQYPNLTNAHLTIQIIGCQ